MSSLKEIHARIVSVKSTLKITSAMKMVASARLRKAQQAIESMRPYEEALQGILTHVGGSTGVSASNDTARSSTVAVVVISSNSALCGGFNAGVLREARSRISQLRSEGREVVVYSIGRKAAEAMRKDGYISPEEHNQLVGHSSYAEASQLAQSLDAAYEAGEYERVELIYNHFVTTASQKVLHETYLPFEMDSLGEDHNEDEMTILEPSQEELLKTLVPKVVRLKLYTAVLDSVAAEHAARTIAMQTATDNGNDMLAALTLEYNKSRQQKITSEILDLVSGAQQ